MLSQRIEQEMLFEQARKLAINGVNFYLTENIYKGEKGLNRAGNLKSYLTSLESKATNKNENLLTLFFAVFGVTTLKKDASFFQKVRNAIDIVPGRSSRLAGIIANKWINGDIIYSTVGNFSRKVTSTVFSREVLDKATGDGGNYFNIPMQYSGYRRFDKTKGTRHILETILNSAEFQMSKESILKSAEKLSVHLQLDAAHFTLDHALLPFPSEDPNRIQQRI